MSRLAIDPRFLPWGRPSAVRLDIGRSRLRLQDGEKQTRHKLTSPIPSGIPDNEQLAALCSGIEALCAALPAGRRTLEITVSDALARCWILERPPGLASPREIQALAVDQMQQLYGDNSDSVAQWTLRLDLTPFTSQWPAVALPTALLELLRDIAGGHGWRIGKIQTRFVSGINARLVPWRKQARNAVYSLETSDGLTIGIRSAGAWLALRTHPPLRLLGTDLPAMLRRDCRVAGIAVEDCRIHALRWPPGRSAP
ncbi:MAG: hypothetical protein ACOYBO_07430 [Azonexus sp.]